MTGAFLGTEVPARYSIVDSIASLAILSENFRNQVHVIGGAISW
jgi:hypothetical protein